jgi:Flp pilus assembly protein TadG
LTYCFTRDDRIMTEAGMQQARRIRLEGRRSGAVIVVVAITLVLIVGMAAFAIDTGMLLSARADAQRAADAAALAAASAYFDAPLAERAALADARGTDFATRNAMLKSQIAADEVAIVLVTNTASTLRARATVTRPEVSTFFAGIWGIKTLPVGAAAEAEVGGAISADCLKPFALPEEDFTSGDKWGELVKIWVVGGEDYVLVGFNDNEPPGLGEIGKFITNKCIDGQTAAMGDTLLWEKPGNVTDGKGGDGHGMIKNAMDELLDMDKTLVYTDGSGFNREDWANSPRVGNVVLYDYDAYKDPGINQIRVSNFARVYFSHTTGQAANPKDPYTIWGRVFPLDGMAGECDTPPCPDNLKRIRLVK